MSMGSGALCVTWTGTTMTQMSRVDRWTFMGAWHLGVGNSTYLCYTFWIELLNKCNQLHKTKDISFNVSLVLKFLLKYNLFSVYLGSSRLTTPISVGRFNCSGTEQTLKDCPHKKFEEDLGCSEKIEGRFTRTSAGVLCYQDPSQFLSLSSMSSLKVIHFYRTFWHLLFWPYFNDVILWFYRWREVPDCWRRKKRSGRGSV